MNSLKKIVFQDLQPVMLTQVHSLTFVFSYLLTYSLMPGTGFSFSLGETTLAFPKVEHAPPEAYFSHGYEA